MNLRANFEINVAWIQFWAHTQFFWNGLDRVLILSCRILGKNSAEGALADAIIDGLHDMRAAVDKGVDVSTSSILDSICLTRHVVARNSINLDTVQWKYANVGGL